MTLVLIYYKLPQSLIFVMNTAKKCKEIDRIVAIVVSTIMCQQKILESDMLKSGNR